MQCSDFVQHLNSFQAGTSLITGIISTGLAGAGAIVTSVNTARALAESAAIVGGARAEFNADIFYEKAVAVIVKAIDQHRKTQREDMDLKWDTSIAQYPVENAIADAFAYNNTCGLVEGLSALDKDVTLANEPGLDALNKGLLKANLTQAIMSQGLTDSRVLNSDGTGNGLLARLGASVGRQGSVATGTMENALNTAIANSSALLDEAVVQLKSINYPKFSESTEANKAAVAAVTQYKADFLLKLDANGVGKTSCLTKINDISPNLAKFRGEYSAAPTGPKRDQAFMDLQNAQLQANNMIGRIQNGERFVTSMITTDISAVNSALTSYKDNTKDADKEKAVTAAIQELTSHFDSTKASTYVMPDPCK